MPVASTLAGAALPNPPTARHRSQFSQDEIARLRELLAELRRSDRGRQKAIRGRLRALGFYISDYAADARGFTRSDLDELIARGTITISNG